MGASREQKQPFATRRASVMQTRGPTAAPIHARAAADKPTTVTECMNGRWKEFGFPDYGACIVFVLSRPPGSAKT